MEILERTVVEVDVGKRVLYYLRFTLLFILVGCVHMSTSPCRGQKKVLNSLEMELEVVNHPRWVLGIEPRKL